MAKTKINTQSISDATTSAKSAKNTTVDIGSAVSSIRWNTDGKILGRNGISGTFTSIQNSISQIATDIGKVCQHADSAVYQYEYTENKILSDGRNMGLLEVKSSSGNGSSANKAAYESFFDKNDLYLIKSGMSVEEYLAGMEGKVDLAEKSDNPEEKSQDAIKASASGSVGNAEAMAGVEETDGKKVASASASASVATGEFEVDVLDGLAKTSGSGTALGAEAEAKAGYENSPDTLEAFAAASAGAYGLKGELNQENLWGLDKFSAKGEVLSAGAEAKAYGSLVHNGVFIPSAGLEAEASASVAKGDVERKLGADRYSVNAAAEGYVVGASAEAEAKFGIVESDDGGTAYGVSAKAGAEAYLAKGEVSGGFTVFGIEFKGTVGGGFGGGELSAGGSLTTESVSLSAGIGAILGVDVEIEIDWSNFGLGLWEDK